MWRCNKSIIALITSISPRGGWRRIALNDNCILPRRSTRWAAENERFQNILDSSDPVSWMTTKSKETILSPRECSWPFRMFWKRIGVLRECHQIHEWWRSHTNTIRSTCRAHRQHCNLKKYPQEPGIFFNPVSSVFGMAWLGLPRRAARYPTLDLWANLYLGTAEDGTAAVASSNPPIPGTLFYIPLWDMEHRAHTLGLICNFSPTTQVNVRQVRIHPIRASKLLTHAGALRLSHLVLCVTVPLENPKRWTTLNLGWMNVPP